MAIPEDRILEVNPEDNAAVRELPSKVCKVGALQRLLEVTETYA